MQRKQRGWLKAAAISAAAIGVRLHPLEQSTAGLVEGGRQIGGGDEMR